MEEERKMKMAMQMTDFEKAEQASTNGFYKGPAGIDFNLKSQTIIE